MVISIASGKGGTGKTTIAVNLALALEKNVQLLDCDVEEPNAQFFLKPIMTSKVGVTLSVPEVDLDRCTFCGMCQKICQFHSIIVIKDNVLVFPELCHSCAGCWLVCPQQCISQKQREIGVLELGKANSIDFVHGQLNIGEPMSPPLIRTVKKQQQENSIVIIDAPPGSSCPVIEAVKGSDFIILVTEPTPFGLHDLKLAVEVVRTLGIKFGVVINRSDIGDDSVRQYCTAEDIPQLMEIKNDRKIAEAYSVGRPMVEIYPEYKQKFKTLFEQANQRMAK